MAWHYLAFAAIPVWIFANVAGLRAFIEFTERNSDRWWGGFPLWMSIAGPAILTTVLGIMVIGFYAATGNPPFS